MPNIYLLPVAKCGDNRFYPVGEQHLIVSFKHVSLLSCWNWASGRAKKKNLYKNNNGASCGDSDL